MNLIPSLTVEQAALQPDLLRLDVREPVETAAATLPEATLIPLGDLPARMNELPQDREIVVFCHHGGRSARAVQLLRDAGHIAFNLEGGIDAWSRRIDPSIPLY